MALANAKPFVWGAGGQQLTPEDLARLEAIEARRQSGGIDTSPVGHWTQGLARVADALGGAIRRGRLAGEREALDADNASLMSDAFKAYGSNPRAGASLPPTSGAALPGSSGEPVPDNVAGIDPGNPVYAGFMDGVKQGGLTNPYGLAAVASTGHAESRFSPGNANRTWSDPSVSGQAGTAGGVMSWRNDRLNNLYSFAGQRGEQPGNISPATQAAFFLQEDPQLIQSLQGARSVEEAQTAMNNAWRFANYDQPGGEAARRLSFAQEMLPGFQGGESPLKTMPFSADQQAALASIPQDQLMQNMPVTPDMQQSIVATPRDQMTTPLQMASASNDPSSILMALAQRGGAVERPESVQRVSQAMSQAPQPQPQQVAQGQQQGQGPTSVAPPDALLRALTSPRATPHTQRVAQVLLENWMKQQQPRELMNLGGGNIYNPNNGQFITAPNAGRQAPTVQEFYDERTGQPYVAQWNRDTGAWDKVGGTKSAPARPLPQNTINALSEAGAGHADMSRIAGGFQDEYGGQPWTGDWANWYGRTFADEGTDSAKQAQWWGDYQGRKNLTRNQLFGSALTATEKGEFEKADINPGMSASAIRANLKRQQDAATRAARRLADSYTAMGYPEDQIEAAIGIPLAELRAAPATGSGGAPAGAVDALRQNPQRAKEFDAKYGQGAAARILGQ